MRLPIRPEHVRPERYAASLAVALAILSGRVLDTTTGQPLAHVRVDAGKAGAITDARGAFVLRGLRAGNVTLTLESDDVPTQHVTVRLSSKTTRRDLRACSTTLDYNCGSRKPAGGESGGAG